MWSRASGSRTDGHDASVEGRLEAKAERWRENPDEVALRLRALDDDEGHRRRQ
jgi:hypothetical protein